MQIVSCAVAGLRYKKEQLCIVRKQFFFGRMHFIPFDICLVCVLHTAILVYSLCKLSLNLNAANASRIPSWEKCICRCLHLTWLQCKGRCKRDMAVGFRKCSAKVLLWMLNYRAHAASLYICYLTVLKYLLFKACQHYCNIGGGCRSHY